MIVPGLSHQHFRIFAPGFCQNIDKLTLKPREAWNDKGTRKYKNIPKQRANKKNKQETKNNMQPADQVTAFHPESPELKAFRQRAVSWGGGNLRSTDARNPQKHGAQNKTANRIINKIGGL